MCPKVSRRSGLIPRAIIVFLLVPFQTGTTADRPDILMILVDDLRPMLGCYGDRRIKTPNIDQLAASSVLFDKAYCQYAKCGTSRLSLMTGLRPDAIGVFSNNQRDVKSFRSRRPDAMSIAAHLKSNGYHTQSFGKIYHDGWDHPDDWTVPSLPGREREMLEIVDHEDPSQPTLIADRFACPVIQSPDVADNHLFAGRMTEAVVRSYEDDQIAGPRFLAVGFRRPHLPFVAPKKYFRLYQPDSTWLTDQPSPPKGSPVIAWFNSDGYVGAAKRFGIDMPAGPSRRQAIDLNGFEMRSYSGAPTQGTIDQATQIRLIHAYAACVSYVDAQIGRLLAALERSGRRDQTIIILTSDHGWHLGEYSAWGKMTNFECATRVPLLIDAPKSPAARTRSIAELVDLYPTLCELCGVPKPAHLEGESLVNHIKTPSTTTGDFARSQYSRNGGKYVGRAIRTQDFRYVVWRDTSDDRVVARELYDHRSDANETQNQADNPDYNAVCDELETRMAG